MMVSALNLARASLAILGPFWAGYATAHVGSVPAVCGLAFLGTALGWSGYRYIAALDRREG